MIDPGKSAIEMKILSVLCIFVFCGILVAGLWPFHRPTNQVTWLSNADGLLLGRHGTVVGSGPSKTSSSQDEMSASIEIWLQPRLVDDSSTILAFYTPEHAIQFSLHQSEADLVLQKGSQNQHIHAKSATVVYVDEVFRERQLVFITITSGRQGSAIYVNGALARTSPQFRLSSNAFIGQLVLGTSPVVNDSWSGQLRGLAFYNQELNAAQVSEHFESWTIKGQPDRSHDKKLLALYLFDEHRGSIVHDRSDSGINLQIPERYLILHEKFLEPPWKEFYVGWSYWKNVGINIGGFIPLGFFFCAYLTMAKQTSGPALVTVLIGAGTSLTIEVLQAYLPTRDSGITDLFTNTMGTGLGVILYRWQAALLIEVFQRIRSAVVRTPASA